MAKRLLPLIPSGLLVQQVLPQPDCVSVLTTPKSPTACCPLCGQPSRRVHSRYTRTLADLPWQGRVVLVRIEARRFRCLVGTCPQRIFAERLPDIAAGAWSRRTARLGDIQRHLGVALGGEAGARLAHRLAMPTSGDTLLRLVRRTVPAVPPAPRVVGVDEWAWRRGQRYGTILVDHERRKVIDLLPDREADTVANWLADHPSVEVVSRDRGAAYADAARRGAPQAQPVADRWHLLENLSQAVRAALDRRKAMVREAARSERSPGAAPVATDVPPPMTSAERRRWDAWQRRRATWEEVVRLNRAGASIKAITRRLGLARGTVRKLLRGGEPAIHRPRQRLLTPHLAFLERRWVEGCCNGAQLWREVTAAGFRGGLRVVSEWANRRRLAAHPARMASAMTAPSARRVAMLLTGDAAKWTPEERLYLECLFSIAPEIAVLHGLAQRFGRMLRQRRAEDLAAWLDEASASDLRSFADGLRQDLAAVRAALATPWSNGQTEGQITRLKLIKRSMYGRAKLDLLRIRVMAA